MPQEKSKLEVRLSDIDLNLLVALDALLEESHVTQAAVRIGLTQSAMSHALQRLRLLLDDPLLVRSKGGMQLTPRAMALQAPIRNGLLEIQKAIRKPTVFEAKTSTRRFILATNDQIQVTLLPHLLEFLSKEAPNIDIRVSPFESAQMKKKQDTDGVDVIIWPDGQAMTGYQQEELYSDRFACLVRKGHPDIDGSLTLKQYTTWPHALISPEGKSGSVVSRKLEQMGKSRRIALEVPHFLAAPVIVARSNLILTAPRQLAITIAQLMPMQILEPPLELPTFNIHLIWHKKHQKDPAHIWLRELITRASIQIEKEREKIEEMIALESGKNSCGAVETLLGKEK